MATKDITKDKDANKRYRVWATVLYPESCADDWRGILGQACVPAFVSPLHDLDVNPTGEVKKAHWHILFMFDGVKSYDQVKALCDSLGAVRPEHVSSLRGYARYLCHLDNPEKTQYSPEDVTAFAGADYFESISIPGDRINVLREMQDWVDMTGCYSYAALNRFARMYRLDWFRALCSNCAVAMSTYCKSAQWERESGFDLDVSRFLPNPNPLDT